jgi:hypothetical protein
MRICFSPSLTHEAPAESSKILTRVGFPIPPAHVLYPSRIAYVKEKERVAEDRY